ncbi:carboxypeptidase regulatory-like domain-containing protein [bacterium]|nr:carboxypeptidase regulatory-like domain-containing protein [bacterium]
MNSWRARVAALLAIAVLMPAFVLGATISGSLRDENWDLITETMEVSIAPYQSDDWTSVTTENGLYSFSDVADGEYWLYARSLEEDSWLIPVYFPGSWIPIFVPPFEVEEGGTYEDMDFFIEMGGRVSGSVVPVEGGSFPANGVALSMAGEFQNVEGVPLENPSDFISQPIPTGFMVLQFATTGENDFHVTTFTGNTWNMWEAETVVILSGQTTDVGTITMDQGGAIEGTVTGEGSPLSNAYVNASVALSPFEPPAYIPGTFTSSDGHYRLRGLPVDHDLGIYFMPDFESPYNSEWYDNASSFETATMLTLTAGELLSGIDADLQPGATFYGTLRNPDGSLPGEEDWYEFIFTDEDGESEWLEVLVNEEGTWESLSSLRAGTWTFSAFNIADPYSLNTFVGNAVWPWDADWLEVGGGDHVGPINLQLGEAGALHGYVLDPDGQAYEFAEVSLIRDGNRIGDTSVDWDGSFAFDNLPAGDYVVVASLWDSEEVDDQWPAVYSGDVGVLSEADVVTIQAGQLTSVDLQFQEGGLVAVEVLTPDDHWYDPFTDNVGIAVFPVSSEGEVLWDVQSDGDDFFVYGTTTMTLPVGSWTLVAVPVYLDFTTGDAPNVRRTFLGDVSSFGNAQTFTVTSGGFNEGIIRMSESGQMVSGSISTVTGRQMSYGPTIAAIDEDGMIASVSASFFGESSDSYELKGLTAGNYRIFAGQEFNAGRYVSTWAPEVGDPGRSVENAMVWPDEAGVVAVSNSDLDGVNIVMQVGSGAVSVDPREEVSVPSGFALKPAYPNPFNAMTGVTFLVPSTSRVKLELVNILGQRVKILEDRTYTAGAHRVMLDASNLTSGLYFIRMEAGSFQAVQKVTLVK